MCDVCNTHKDTYTHTHAFRDVAELLALLPAEIRGTVRVTWRLEELRSRLVQRPVVSQRKSKPMTRKEERRTKKKSKKPNRKKKK